MQLKSFPMKDKDNFPFLVNIMADDGVVMQGTKASAAMITTFWYGTLLRIYCSLFS